MRHQVSFQDGFEAGEVEGKKEKQRLFRVEAKYHFNEQDYNFHMKWRVWSGRKQRFAISLEMSINKEKDVG